MQLALLRLGVASEGHPLHPVSRTPEVVADSFSFPVCSVLPWGRARSRPTAQRVQSRCRSRLRQSRMLHTPALHSPRAMAPPVNGTPPRMPAALEPPPLPPPAHRHLRRRGAPCRAAGCRLQGSLALIAHAPASPSARFIPGWARSPADHLKQSGRDATDRRRASSPSLARRERRRERDRERDREKREGGTE